jgi:hypothetical protein
MILFIQQNLAPVAPSASVVVQYRSLFRGVVARLFGRVN